MPTGQWPSSRDYVEAVQNPALAFQDPDLKAATPAIDRLGMPFVTSGQFAYVFKLNTADGKAQAVRCFRGSVGDREDRYQRIDDHLDKVSAPCFVSFEYDPQGIMAGGQRYPIQVMEWIGGFPLDVYLSNVIGTKDLLKFLADQWLKALATLRDGSMAHGDLQHGNVIVDECNSLRLVDLDGMYVPSMAGWKSSELGHRHYQHPKRSADHFDARLDNFSGLVIYLSLIALMEQPNLWQEFHDENLIFVKSDFENPLTSKLLSKIKAIGGECRQLAEALEKACSDDPLRCPSVLELVSSTPSKLPAWMVNSPVVTVQQTTREVKPGQTPPPPASSPVSYPAPSSQPGQPWYSATPANVTAASPAPTAQAAIASQIVPRDVARHTLTYAYMGIFLIWLWLPMLRLPFVGLGAAPIAATWLAIGTYLAACMLFAYRRLLRESKPHVVPAKPAASWTPTSPVSTPVARPTTTTYSSYSTRTRSTSSSSPGTSTAFVGSKVGQKYHRPSCKWALKISYRNRVNFSSEADAKGRGYRPCSVCSP